MIYLLLVMGLAGSLAILVCLALGMNNDEKAVTKTTAYTWTVCAFLGAAMLPFAAVYFLLKSLWG